MPWVDQEMQKKLLVSSLFWHQVMHPSLLVLHCLWTVEDTPCVRDNTEGNWETPSVQDMRDNVTFYADAYGSHYTFLSHGREGRVRDESNISVSKRLGAAGLAEQLIVN